MRFVWDDINIRRAKLLAEKGYTAIEAASAMGTSRSSLSCRACRKKEFSFVHAKSRPQIGPAGVEANIVEAKAIIEKEIPRTSPACRAMVAVTPSKRPTQPQVARVNTIVETPLTEKEKVKFFKDEEANEFSVTFIDMEKHHCRYPVAKNEYNESVICGRKRVTGSSYCEHHKAKSSSRYQPKPIKTSAVHSWDQSTKPGGVRKLTVSSLLRRNSVDTGSSSS